MQDLMERAEEALDLARRRGALAAEAYVLDAPSNAVSFEPSGSGENLQLRTAITVPQRGLGLVARWDSGVGFGSTTDLSAEGLLAAVDGSRYAASPDAEPLVLAAAEQAAGPGLGGRGSAPAQDLRLADSRLVEMNLAGLVHLTREVAGEALELGARVLSAVCLSRCRRVAVANSAGLARSSADTLISAMVHACSAGGGLAYWARSSRDLGSFKSMSVGRTAAELAAKAADPRDVEPGVKTVVLAPDAVLSLLAFSLGPALGADRVRAGRSPFGGVPAPGSRAPSGRGPRAAPGPVPGAEVAAPILSITDDALLPGGTGSYEFDAEGTPGRRTPVIRDGRLVSLLHSNGTAAAAGVSSTGNASRERGHLMTTFVEPSGPFGCRPGVSPSNLVVEAPGAAFAGPAEAGVDRGLYVLDVMGSFVIDPAVGDFSVTTTNAWAIEEGTWAWPVKRAMLTGNVYGLLRRVAALVGEPEDVAGPFAVSTPAWIVPEVAVA